MRQRAGAVIYPESVDLVDRSERPVTVGVLDKILRVGEGKTLRRLVAIAASVNAIEDEFVQHTHSYRPFGSVDQVDALGVNHRTSPLAHSIVEVTRRSRRLAGARAQGSQLLDPPVNRGEAAP